VVTRFLSNVGPALERLKGLDGSSSPMAREESGIGGA
jgi:hypothetical protein